MTSSYGNPQATYSSSKKPPGKPLHHLLSRTKKAKDPSPLLFPWPFGALLVRASDDSVRLLRLDVEGWVPERSIPAVFQLYVGRRLALDSNCLTNLFGRDCVWGGEPGVFSRRWVRVSLLGSTCFFLLLSFFFFVRSNFCFLCGRILAFRAVELLFSCTCTYLADE